MKKFAFLLSLTLVAGCGEDDDLALLPTPVAEVPAPGELPTSVTVVQLNIQDVICPGVSALNRSGILTHTWTSVTRYDAHSDEVVIEGDVDISWSNSIVTACESTTTVLNTRQVYPQGPVNSDVFISATPEYFTP